MSACARESVSLAATTCAYVRVRFLHPPVSSVHSWLSCWCNHIAPAPNSAHSTASTTLFIFVVRVDDRWVWMQKKTVHNYCFVLHGKFKVISAPGKNCLFYFCLFESVINLKKTITQFENGKSLACLSNPLNFLFPLLALLCLLVTVRELVHFQSVL